LQKIQLKTVNSTSVFSLKCWWTINYARILTVSDSSDERVLLTTLPTEQLLTLNCRLLEHLGEKSEID